MTDEQHDEHAEQPRGRMRYQDPDSAQPREPSVAEQRARRKAEEREAARVQAEQEEAERKADRNRKLKIGGGVTVGIAALVGAWYLSTPSESETVTARCAQADGEDKGKVADEKKCDRDYVESHGGHVGAGGLLLLPLATGGFGQYHYNYGGTVQNGHVVGGSTTKPKGKTVKTGSGKTIQRGGFGGGKRGGFGGFGG